MATRHIWKASILTALLLLAPAVSADDSSNAEDANQGSSDAEEGPCEIVFIAVIPPTVDPHPECLPDIFP